MFPAYYQLHICDESLGVLRRGLGHHIHQGWSKVAKCQIFFTEISFHPPLKVHNYSTFHHFIPTGPVILGAVPQYWWSVFQAFCCPDCVRAHWWWGVYLVFELLMTPNLCKNKLVLLREKDELIIGINFFIILHDNAMRQKGNHPYGHRFGSMNPL